jgi:drug/metabolite transporter (DMT)-like permease
VILSNIIYNICQKSTPDKVNPFTALIVTYFVAIILASISFCFYKTDKSFIQSFKYVNWTSIVLGIAIFGLEFGYLMAYRAGWNISIVTLVANIILAVALIPVGVILYKEGFEISKIFGAVICIIGLIIINR